LQLGLAFGLIIALLLAATLFGINSLSSTNSAMNAMVDGPAVRLQAAQQLNIHLLNVVRAEKNMVLVDTPEEVKTLEATINKEKHAFENAVDQGRRLGDGGGQAQVAGPGIGLGSSDRHPRPDL
jgi:methyl-accepting chemotaxis protein